MNIAERKAYHDWLAKLSKGDEVATTGRYGTQGIGVVERQTATQIVLRDGSRYRLKDGYVVGDGYGQLQPITDAYREGILARKRRDQFVSEARTANSLTDGEISAMLFALKLHRQGRPT